jgi:hypothetical protein
LIGASRVTGKCFTEKYPKVHAVATTSDFTKNRRCPEKEDCEIYNPDLDANSGEYRDKMSNGIKIAAAEADPRNSTGNTALWLTPVFLNIS